MSIGQLRELLAQSSRTVYFTGAGMSTESGIPDYRGPNGIWKSIRPIYYREFVDSADARREAWRRVFQRRHDWTKVRPNRGHEILAALVASRRQHSIVTQNIDNLHQSSGVPAAQIIELHGNASYAACISCRSRFELEQLAIEFEAAAEVAPCRHCGGLVKSAVVAFGEPMPDGAMQRARELAAAAELFVVLGSSLSVQPAASFPLFAKTRGASLVIVNQQPTHADRHADLLFHDSISSVLELISAEPRTQ